MYNLSAMGRHIAFQNFIAEKSKYQVFTPEDMVEEMLDLAGYREGVLGKRILENSFGDGRFLLSIVKRYIEEAIYAGHSSDEIRQELHDNVVGFETDAELFEVAKKQLDDLATSYGLNEVAWDLRLGDALFADIGSDFHFVVGNPPYLEYKMLESDYRNLIRNRFACCSSGKFDYCYAFLELAINCLGKNGVMVQLVPNSIFKNVFARELREKLLDGITDIVDYAEISVFGNVLVSPCVLKYSKGDVSDAFVYCSKAEEETRIIPKNSLGAKWTFGLGDKALETSNRFGAAY